MTEEKRAVPDVYLKLTDRFANASMSFISEVLMKSEQQFDWEDMNPKDTASTFMMAATMTTITWIKRLGIPAFIAILNIDDRNAENLLGEFARACQELGILKVVKLEGDKHG